MADYKIVRVSEQPPREWAPADNPERKTYYIKVQLEGHPRPVSIGKKKPDALKVGDIVSGTIIPDASHDEDKFKADQTGGFGGGGGGTRQFKADPERQHSIEAQFAIKTAIEYISNDEATELSLENVEAIATDLFAMIERVKGSTSDNLPTATHQTPQNEAAVPPAKKEPARDWDNVGKGKPDEVITDIGDDPINLDDIPF